MTVKLWRLARKYIETIMTEPDTIKTQLEKCGFVADISPTIYSRSFTQGCPRNTLDGKPPVLYIILGDDETAEFKVHAAGRTGVVFEMAIPGVPFDKVVRNITNYQDRFANAIVFFQ